MDTSSAFAWLKSTVIWARRSTKKASLRDPRRGSNHGEPLSPSSVEFGGDRYVETGEGALTAVVVFAALSVHSVLAGLGRRARAEEYRLC